MRTRNHIKGVTCAALIGIALTAPTASAIDFGSVDSISSSPQADNTPQDKVGAGTLEQLNEATFLIKPAEGVSIDTDKNTISQDGKTENLPTEAKDKNGAPVDLKYVKTDKGVEIRVISKYQDRGIAKCALGTAGGAITGAGTVGLTGAGVGAVTIPIIGAVPGGVVGTVVGGVGGAATGAALSCW